MSQRKQVLSLSVDTGSYQSFIERIISLASSRNSSYVCIANVHMCMEAQKDKEFAQKVNSADLVTPDGMPLAKSIKWLYGIPQERVAGMDLLPDLLNEAEKKGIGVFFYGGTQKTLDKTKFFLELHCPNIINKHFYSPPFRALNNEEEESVINLINNSGAKLIFVVLGCPKQERWMAAMHGKINGCMVGIGAALPVMIGQQKRAPEWMQNASLEWLFRLVQEPQRLWKRYLFGNTSFIFHLIKEKIKLKGRK